MSVDVREKVLNVLELYWYVLRHQKVAAERDGILRCVYGVDPATGHEDGSWRRHCYFDGRFLDGWGVAMEVVERYFGIQLPCVIGFKVRGGWRVEVPYFLALVIDIFQRVN